MIKKRDENRFNFCSTGLHLLFQSIYKNVNENISSVEIIKEIHYIDKDTIKDFLEHSNTCLVCSETKEKLLESVPVFIKPLITNFL